MNISFNKSLLIKILIVLVAAVVVYSVFWFFKLGQVEKQINRFVNEHSSNVSVGDIAVSGFPFSQKVTISDLRFSLPTPALDKRQVLVKTLEASAGIFESEFAVTVTGQVLIFDQEGGSANLEFNAPPRITVSISSGLIEKLTYQDSGYRIVDPAKGPIYSASSSSVNVESVIDENEQVTFKINVEISEIDGFGVIDIYKNAFEKRIIDALKTGELAMGNQVNTAGVDQSVVNATVDPVVVPTDPNAVATALPAEVKDLQPVVAPVENAAAPLDPVAPSVNNESNLEALNPPSAAPVADAAVAAIADATPIKSSFSLNAEYILTPNQVEQQTPMDLSQMQETPLQYSKTIKINNLRFTNILHEITVNGEVKIFSDDSLPSGGISIKVSKFDDALSQAVTGLKRLAKKVVVENEIKPVDLSGLSAAAATNNDSYEIFLERIAASLASVSKEVAVKNAVTKDNVAQFDIRREKNLDFLVNETPVREILGKL
jgi:hypothetical protein